MAGAVQHAKLLCVELREVGALRDSEEGNAEVASGFEEELLHVHTRGVGALVQNRQRRPAALLLLMSIVWTHIMLFFLHPRTEQIQVP